MIHILLMVMLEY